jgi:hypothetical protein
MDEGYVRAAPASNYMFTLSIQNLYHLKGRGIIISITLPPVACCKIYTPVRDTIVSNLTLVE